MLQSWHSPRMAYQFVCLTIYLIKVKEPIAPKYVAGEVCIGLPVRAANCRVVPRFVWAEIWVTNFGRGTLGKRYPQQPERPLVRRSPRNHPCPNPYPIHRPSSLFSLK